MSNPMSNKVLQEAIAACEHALHPTFQLRPFQAAAQRMGNVLQGYGRFEEAVIWHTQASITEPDLAQVYLGLGRLYFRQEGWPEAIAAYQQVIHHNPDIEEPYWKLASIYYHQDQRQAALHHWYQALAFDPYKATPDGHVKFGHALLKFGQVKEALNCYRRAIYIDADYVPAYRELAQGFLKQGRRDEAVAIYREAITRVTQPGVLYHDLGQIFRDQDQMDSAMATFQQAMAHDPDYPWNHHDWVQLLLDQQRWDEVIAASIATIERDPTAPWAYTQMGRALMATGKRHEAIACNQKACALRGWSRCQQDNYQFSQDWFSHNIPIWLEYLQPLIGQPDLQAIEVGSFQGMSACWLLEHVLTHPSAHLTCIDCHFQPEFDENIAKSVGKANVADRITKREGISDAILPTLPHNRFDLIYIDGGHKADVVERDGHWAWQNLKSGGILIFDDYYWSDPNFPDQDPKKGIDAVLRRIQPQSAILYRDYQIILKKN